MRECKEKHAVGKGRIGLGDGNLEAIGNILPAEAEERYYALLDETSVAA